MTIYGWYKLATDADYDPQTQFTVTNGSATISLDNKFEWNVRIAIKDKISTWIVYDNLYVGVGIPIVFFDKLKKSVGINCLPNNNNDLEVNGASVVKQYSENERVVGFWIDGEPIYEQTVILSSAVTLAANANTNIMNWTVAIKPIYFKAYRISTTPYVSWEFIGATVQSGKLVGISPRDTSVTMDAFTIQYIKVPTT